MLAVLMIIINLIAGQFMYDYIENPYPTLYEVKAISDR